MSWRLPSIPYPAPKQGFWEPVTSTLNWCEEDYYATIYSAEIVNTLTNLIFMYLAQRGIRNCLRHGHDTIFLIAFIGYLIVGTGSFLFHSTLKYPMQLVDELSMIYTTCLMCFATFAFAKSLRTSIMIGIFLVGLAVGITLYYHYLQDPTFHQNMYALLTAIVLLRCMWVMETQLRPSNLAKQQSLGSQGSNGTTKQVASKPQPKPEQDQRLKGILKQMWLMIAYGLSIFLLGFFIWTMDNDHCSSLRRWRKDVGLPWGILSEGHGWWHLFTGIGAYYYIVWGIWLRHCLNGKQDQYDLVWPRVFTSFPDIVRREQASKKSQ